MRLHVAPRDDRLGASRDVTPRMAVLQQHPFFVQADTGKSTLFTLKNCRTLRVVSPLNLGWR